ncbi:PIR protein [Plasmodium vivax]|uniref:VIR protein n=1 Tax=Plasmodium vivax TaxID=5855 RepID=A0A564ZRA0_PLAVI|nr:PIR protein [Plasmodium vivax]VUZ93436.1 PIR protein [Plasmodium vivax]
MSSVQEDLWYIDYNDYMDVIDKHKNAIGYPYEEEYLDNIMPDLRTQIPNLNKDEDIIKKYFRLLRNDRIFYAGQKNNYCKYINFWLNKEYRDKDYHKKIPKFDFFKTFISKLNYEIHKNNTTTCENYINHLDTERISKIDFLHLLYDAYNKINNLSKFKLNDTCSDIALLDKNYNTSIYDYYVSDKNLFNKIERIKGLILGIKEKYKSPCTNSLYFSTPQKLIDLQEKEALEARLEELRKQKEEAERRESEEQLSKGNAEMEQQQAQLLRSNVASLHLHQGHTLQGTPLEGEFQSTGDSEDLRTSAVSELREHAHMSQFLERSKSPRDSLFLQEHTPEGRIRYKIEENEPLGEESYAQNDVSRTNGTSFGASGFPGYITEVLGSVEPGPVLGVSGGMGVLFLLFKYTPVGSFFGGRRGRFRQIPRSFGGFQPDFTNFQDYDGGYIRYGPMSISSLAE